MLLLAVPAPAAGQGILEQFSYEGLRFSGLGVDVGPVFSDRLESDVMGSLRIDYGMFAPRIRLLIGFSYFRSRFEQAEITEFETRLEALVNDPGVSISIGEITWSDAALDLDLQYLFGPARRVTPYVGLGLGVHVRNAAGAAIDGTFVDDALDTVAAGLNVSTGVEVTIVRNLRFTTDLRGSLSSELVSGSARAGLMLRLPPRGGGGGGP